VSATPETLYDAIQAQLPNYPTRRGAMLPALHLTQEAYGWLSPEALIACSDAIGFSPAYCQAVASFYDMFFLAPVGAHTVDVCTNLACGLRGAGEVLEAFEQELGVSAGETTDDGAFTLRPIECLGGCGWATIVSIDEHYRTHVKPEDVPAIVEELRSGD